MISYYDNFIAIKIKANKKKKRFLLEKSTHTKENEKKNCSLIVNVSRLAKKLK